MNRSGLILLFWVLAAAPVFTACPPGGDLGLVALTAPEGWVSVPPAELAADIRSRQNANIHLVGFRPGEALLTLIKVDDNTRIVPLIQVTAAPQGGLSIGDNEIGRLEDTIPKVYSRRVGGPFTLLTITRREIAGIRGARLTGIYRWRTVNIKMVQYLVPAAGHVYGVTFLGEEREFNRLLPDVEAALAGIRFADPPLVPAWLEDLLRWLVLLGLICTVVWLMLYISGREFSRPRRPPKIGSEGRRTTAVNPFMRGK